MLYFCYPFRDASGKTVSDSFSKARAAAIKLASAGFTVVGQTCWPGGMGADSSGQRTWLLHTGIPEAYARYDEDLTYDKMAEATRYIARSLKKYVEYWLVSNEPDIETYTGPMTDAQILRYINSCAKGIKEGNPNAKCGINLLGLVNPARSKLFVSRLYGNDSCLDWLGLDGYFGSLQAERGRDMGRLHNSVPCHSQKAHHHHRMVLSFAGDRSAQYLPAPVGGSRQGKEGAGGFCQCLYEDLY